MLIKNERSLSGCYRLLSIAIEYYPLSQSTTIDNNFFLWVELLSITDLNRYQSVIDIKWYRWYRLISDIDFYGLTTPGNIHSLNSRLKSCYKVLYRTDERRKKPVKPWNLWVKDWTTRSKEIKIQLSRVLSAVSVPANKITEPHLNLLE